MIFYPIDYVIEEIKKNEPSLAQINLKRYAGADFAREEATYVWQRVIDHKWYMGERLKRDIGLRVAAIDFIENFYDATTFRQINRPKGFFRRFSRPAVSQTLRNYFVAKSVASLNL